MEGRGGEGRGYVPEPSERGGGRACRCVFRGGWTRPGAVAGALAPPHSPLLAGHLLPCRCPVATSPSCNYSIMKPARIPTRSQLCNTVPTRAHAKRGMQATPGAPGRASSSGLPSIAEPGAAGGWPGAHAAPVVIRGGARPGAHAVPVGGAAGGAAGEHAMPICCAVWLHFAVIPRNLAYFYYSTHNLPCSLPFPLNCKLCKYRFF